MKGITFGTTHSFNSWGLILTDKEIGIPKPKTMKLEIEGADGVLDYTEYFGGVKYDNRVLKFSFEIGGKTSSEFLDLISDIQDVIHGKVLQITLDDDPDYYYKGRAMVTNLTLKKGIGTVEFEVDAEPYKLKKNATKVSFAVSGTKQITLVNERKPVVPTITTTAGMTIVFGGFTHSANAGTYRIPELELKQGQNTLTVTGSGNITFEYQEGRL